MWPFSNFYLLIFKNSILFICLVYIIFAVYFLLAYLYAKLFTVFVYGSWICIFFNEYIWKPVYNLVTTLMPLQLRQYTSPTRTENTIAYVIPHSTTDYYQQSFFPRTAKEWLNYHSQWFRLALRMSSSVPASVPKFQKRYSCCPPVMEGTRE